jgi:hypothetical protein
LCILYNNDYIKYEGAVQQLFSVIKIQRRNPKKVNFVRYADDFIITADSEETKFDNNRAERLECVTSIDKISENEVTKEITEEEYYK